MSIALLLGLALQLASFGTFKCAMSPYGAAGAGALGSIMLVGSAAINVLGIFCFGVAAGLYFHS